MLVATWTSAFATVGLLIGAAVTAYYARLAFRKQSTQLCNQQAINSKLAAVADLQVQELQESLHERQVSAAQLRRFQASQVFVTERRLGHDPALFEGGVPPEMRGQPIPMTVTAYISNSSDQPVYDAALKWIKGGRPYAHTEHLRTMPPREQHESKIVLHDGTDAGQVTAWLQFRDAAGVYWLRGGNGELEEISEEDIERPARGRFIMHFH
jgi:hypothetical protein